MKKTIAIIEEKNKFSGLLKCRLESIGYKVYVSHDLLGGVKNILILNPVLVIVSSSYYRANNLSLVKEIRKTSNTKIIVIGKEPKESEFELIKSYNISNYIVEPIDLEKVVYKINLLFSDEKTIKKKENYDYSFDSLNNIIKIGNKKIKVFPKEFIIIKYLFENIDTLIEKEKLAEVCSFDKKDKILANQYIKKIRIILKNTDYEIITHYAKGYELIKK